MNTDNLFMLSSLIQFIIIHKANNNVLASALHVNDQHFVNVC